MDHVIFRRLFAILGLLIATAVPGAVLAQAWPERPIKVIVSFAPGGVHDTLARLYQPRLAAALGQPILIENRGGAAGNLAAEAVARSAPDGYTFLVASEAVATNEFLYGKLRYDLDRDLAPVAKLADFPLALVVHPSVAANSIGELVTLSKDKPGSLSYGSAGIGASGHLAGELFKTVTGADMVHVPYKGGAPALTDLAAGRIHVMFLSVLLSAPQVAQGKLKALAVVGARRSERMTQVPTSAEAGYPAVDALLFSSMFAPAGTPEAITTRMSSELGRALLAPDLRERIADIGAVATPSTPAELGQFIREVRARWGKLIRDKNIRIEQ